MLPTVRKTFLVFIGLIATPSALSAAAFKCDEGYQNVSGNSISTPYCQDAYLAEVARTYGMKVSANAVRNNPNLKSEVCRFVGHDNRVRDNCLNEQGVSPSRR